MTRLTGTLKDAIETIDGAQMLSHVERWAQINSGTSNHEGLARMAQELSDAFSVLPGEITLEEPAPVTAVDAAGKETAVENGKHFLLRVRPEAERRFILTGHMDTVFPADHPFQQLTWLDEETLNGPGTADMKGGLAIILASLRALEGTEAWQQVGYDVLINADEETGSLSSAPLIERTAQGKYAALTFEPAATSEGRLAHARGGSGNYSLTVTGKSAHAGRNPQDGRNAIVAASTLAVRLKELQRDDISVNPAKIDGGAANNVVPDHAVLRFNIRPKEPAAAERFEAEMNALIAEVKQAQEVDIAVHGGISRPPKPVDRQAQKLFDLVRDCGAELGQEIDWQPTGGVCDGNNIAATGVPVVDTMGVRGGKIHSPDEFMIAPSLKERAALAAMVLHQLATENVL
ncbi:hydrolase [Erythrobacter sp. 3-20A1M]|uniref:hydrolase n=1 Tax=Erythrobacter sp. 3-20A1M TaxID=2653850 RepID=UPI001BFC55AE|nr:hydrolase [Erythrobacter sp. 3-20A1M]QWC56066.1 hydrolase [Erythrobacter sp. 3-20A1M]